MLDNIKEFFKKFNKNNGKLINPKSTNKDSAKERLHLVLMQDRANVSADFLDLMKQEIIEVIKKYIDIDERQIDVKLTNKQNSDGTTGAPALYANIPIKGIRSSTRKIKTTKKSTGVTKQSSTSSSTTNTKQNTTNNNINIKKDNQNTNKENEKNNNENSNKQNAKPNNQNTNKENVKQSIQNSNNTNIQKNKNMSNNNGKNKNTNNINKNGNNHNNAKNNISQNLKNTINNRNIPKNK